MSKSYDVEGQVMDKLEDFHNAWIAVSEPDGTVKSYGRTSPVFMLTVARDLLARLCQTMEVQELRTPEDQESLLSLHADLLEIVQSLQKVERAMGAIGHGKFASS
jgi:hypothetical protein